MDKQLQIPYDKEIDMENKYKIMMSHYGCIGFYIYFYINWKHIKTKIKDFFKKFKHK